MLTNQQYQTLKAAILADSTAAALLAAGRDNAVKDYFNAIAAPAVAAWRLSVSRVDLFNSMDVTQYDGLSAGKRDSWRLVMDMAPVDATRAKIRKAVEDVWTSQAATRDAILTDMTRSATRAEVVFGGIDKTAGTITAKNLNWEGLLTDADIVAAKAS